MTRPIRSSAGKPKRATAKAVAEDLATYRLMVENATDLIVRGDASRQRTYVSPSSREVLGYEPAELLGKHAFELVHPDDLARVAETFGRVGPDHPILRETFRMRRKDGKFVWIEGRYRHLPDDGGLLAVLRDITMQKQTEEALASANRKLAAANAILKGQVHLDGLTGIANRRRFDEAMQEECRRARRFDLPVGLVLLDIDCFKAFNDTYGHLAGDDCLRRISQAIATAVRRPGDQVARYGGEEFAALLPGTNTESAVIVAEDMLGAVLALDIAHAGSPHGQVTVSAGVASQIPDGDPSGVLALIDTADRALYRAKSDGRGCVRDAGGLRAPRHDPAIMVV